MQVISNPLAGSRPRSEDPVEDKRRAEELLSSPKDLHEHAVVVEAVAGALRPYCHTLHVPEKPSVIHSEAMWHLSTEVKGELKDKYFFFTISNCPSSYASSLRNSDGKSKKLYSILSHLTASSLQEC